MREAPDGTTEIGPEVSDEGPSLQVMHLEGQLITARRQISELRAEVARLRDREALLQTLVRDAMQGRD